MMFLGLLLMVAAAAGVVIFSIEETTTASTSVTVLDRTVEASQLEIFLAGAATAAIFLFGLMLVVKGMRRSLMHRRDLRRSRSAAQNRVARLEEEKRELQRRLEATPAGSDPASTPDGESGTTPAPRVAPESHTDLPRTTDSRAADSPAAHRPTPTENDRLVAGPATRDNPR